MRSIGSPAKAVVTTADGASHLIRKRAQKDEEDPLAEIAAQLQKSRDRVMALAKTVAAKPSSVEGEERRTPIDGIDPQIFELAKFGAVHDVLVDKAQRSGLTKQHPVHGELLQKAEDILKDVKEGRA